MESSQQGVDTITFCFTVEAEEDLEEYFEEEDGTSWDMTNKTISIDKNKLNYKLLIQQIMQVYTWLEWEDEGLKSDEISWDIYDENIMITNNSELMNVIHKYNDSKKINLRITAEYETQPLVIENGSFFMKAGFAGDDAPRAVFPTVVGRPMKYPGMLGMAVKDAYVGDEAQTRRRYGMTMNYPIEKRVVTSWDDMEKIWHHTLYNELRIQPEEHFVLLTDTFNSSTHKSERERITQIMFETFNVLGFYIIYYPICSLYACDSRRTGVVLDSGYSVTECVPVYNGQIISNAISVSNFGGYDIQQHLLKIINEKSDWSVTTSVEREIVRDMKEKYCYVTNELDLKKNIEYEWPDGRIYNMKFRERTEPAECLFKPDILGKTDDGIHRLIYKSVMKCDLSIQYELFSNIILSGGNTMFDGICERLKYELESITENDNLLVDGYVRMCTCNKQRLFYMDIMNLLYEYTTKYFNIIALPYRKYSVWIGASNMSSNPEFWDKGIQKEHYDDIGPTIVHQKCFTCGD